MNRNKYYILLSKSQGSVGGYFAHNLYFDPNGCSTACEAGTLVTVYSSCQILNQNCILYKDPQSLEPATPGFYSDRSGKCYVVSSNLGSQSTCVTGSTTATGDCNNGTTSRFTLASGSAVTITPGGVYTTSGTASYTCYLYQSDGTTLIQSFTHSQSGAAFSGTWSPPSYTLYNNTASPVTYVLSTPQVSCGSVTGRFTLVAAQCNNIGTSGTSGTSGGSFNVTVQYQINSTADQIELPTSSELSYTSALRLIALNRPMFQHFPSSTVTNNGSLNSTNLPVTSTQPYVPSTIIINYIVKPSNVFYDLTISVYKNGSLIHTRVTKAFSAGGRESGSVEIENTTGFSSGDTLKIVFDGPTPPPTPDVRPCDQYVQLNMIKNGYVKFFNCTTNQMEFRNIQSGTGQYTFSDACIDFSTLAPGFPLSNVASYTVNDRGVPCGSNPWTYLTIYYDYDINLRGQPSRYFAGWTSASAACSGNRNKYFSAAYFGSWGGAGNPGEYLLIWLTNENRWSQWSYETRTRGFLGTGLFSRRIVRTGPDGSSDIIQNQNCLKGAGDCRFYYYCKELDTVLTFRKYAVGNSTDIFNLGVYSESSCAV